MAQKSKPLLQVKVGRPDGPAVAEEEMKNVRDRFSEFDAFDDYEVVVSGYDLDISEVPALDDYADELADRIAERLNHD